MSKSDSARKPNAAPKASEAPVACGACMEWDPSCEDCLRSSPPEETDPAPEPDPLKGIDAQKWAKEFMRIWSGRWSEVDEGLMIGWFANAIMRGFDEGQRRLRKQHGCELPPLAEPKPSAPPAPEPKCYHCETCRKQCSPKTGQSICCNCKRELAPEPKQGSACCEECKRYHRHFRTDCCKCRTSFGPSDIPEAEPKQGSEEPIEPVTELEAEKSTSKILRNLLVKAEAERDEARATKDMHKERQEEAWAAVAALRAEVEKLKRLDIRPSTGSDLLWVEGKHRCAAGISNNHLWQVEDEAEVLRAQLAARARKEGGSR